ncbi:MAG: imidazole glycerol phosphate synthase subunit HisH [bacterium]
MIVIIDYKAGNLTSVQLGFGALGLETRVTCDQAEIERADRLVFPGVGAAGAAMHNLKELGLVAPLRAAAARGIPFLGICLGTQIILGRSEEDGGVDTLGLLAGQVRRFQPVVPTDKVPQIGWNSVDFRRPHPVLAGLAMGSEFYFVHSYYPAPANAADIIGVTEYAGATFASLLGRGNIVAAQFHPEKSGRIGLQLLKNFSDWDGKC